MTTETTTPAPAAAAPPPAAAGVPAPAGGAAPVPPAAPAAPASALADAGAVKEPAAAPAPKEGEKPAAPAKPAKPADAPKAAELKVPKGFESVTDALQSTVKELGLEGEKAQKFADSVATIDAARGKALDAAAEAQEQSWLTEAKADPDIGGAKWEGAMKDVSKAMSKFGGPLVQVGDRQLPELAVLLTKAGLGNNKHVLKAFALVGRALKDDSIQGTEKPAPKTEERVSDEEALYGKKPTNPAE